MANTFTADAGIGSQTIAGNMRLVVGKLTMTDGGAGSSVASGLRRIYGGSACPITATTQMTGFKMNDNVDGDILVQSCGSGDTFNVFVVGY